MLQRLRRHALPLLSATRAGVGVSMLAAPSLLPRTLGVDSTTAARLGWMTRMVGARELALGAGTLVALRRGRRVEEWALAQVLCDAVDALAVGSATARGHVRRLPGGAVAATAASATALGAVAVLDLREG